MASLCVALYALCGNKLALCPPTRAELKQLADHFAACRFGENYHPEIGIVHFPSSQVHLKPEIAEIRHQE